MQPRPTAAELLATVRQDPHDEQDQAVDQIRDVTLDSLRTQVSFVFQETYLFSDTVAGGEFACPGRAHARWNGPLADIGESRADTPALRIFADAEGLRHHSDVSQLPA